MERLIYAVVVTLFVMLNAYAAESDSCGCMKKTHDKIKSTYQNIEQENGLIWDESESILKNSSAPLEAKTAAKQEQEEIVKEKEVIKKHLELIQKGMDDNAHMVMMEGYNEILRQHAGLLDNHSKLYIKFKLK